MCCVDFYILDSVDPRNRLLIACRLCEKAWHSGYRILILSETKEQQDTVDNLLWTFRPGSFVPHAIESNRTHARTPVILSDSLKAERDINLLINLKTSAIDPPERIERIIEIVNQEEQVRLDGRQRYRYYQQTGKTLRSHQISV
ncbi:MAG: DNA polymerase III subunit chi [Methylococcaceae bacterium]|nr:DNA polymerase III subunit chi [Methylococcaceae bacterium]